MPKVEVGSMKYLNNKLKFKGLQRLRWYCQVCERQMRDENGFKMHTQSESHVRQMLLVGEDPKKYISYYSTARSTYTNATKWPSLTEFAKFLGREGICRVEEMDKGIHIAWIDNSPEALRRQDAIRKKERQDRGDEAREQMLIREQVRKAKLDAEARDRGEGDDDEQREVKCVEGEKIKLNFGKKAGGSTTDQTLMGLHDLQTDFIPSAGSLETTKPIIPVSGSGNGDEANEYSDDLKQDGMLPISKATLVPEKASVKIGFQSKSKNVFAAAKKNTLAGRKQ